MELLLTSCSLVQKMQNEPIICHSRVLIINFHSTLNAGDLSLLLASRDLIQQLLPDSIISVSANWPRESLYQEHGFKIVPSLRSIIQDDGESKSLSQVRKLIRSLFWLHSGGKQNPISSSGICMDNLQALKKAYLEADLIFAAPGNQLYSSGRFGWPYPVTIAAIQLANWYKKPLIVLPQSIGPLRRNWEKRLLFKAYSPAKLIYLRDAISLRLADKIRLDQSKVHFGWDLAFRLQPAKPSIAQDVLRSSGVRSDKLKLGITLIPIMGKSLDHGDVNYYYQILKQALKKFSQRQNVQLVLFNQVSGPSLVEDDRVPTKLFFQDLKRDNVDVIFMDDDLSPEVLKACYGQMNMFVASRLHSGIFSFGMGVPTLFIGYLTKTTGLLESLGMPEMGLEISNLDPDALFSKLTWLWDNLNGQHARIQAKLITIKHEMDEQEKQLGDILNKI